MRLRYRAIAIVTIAFILFLSTAWALSLTPMQLDFYLLGAAVACLTLFLLQRFIFNRLEQLNQQLKLISGDSNHFQVLDIKGKDESAEIASEMNKVFVELNTGYKALMQHTSEHNEILENRNRELQQEINERISAEVKSSEHRDTMAQLAHYDNLTTLPNRIFFNEILNKTIKHAKRHEKICAVLVLDLDNFKNINATMGHNMGDYILKKMSERLANTLRAEDILARFDADQFIVLLNDIGKPKFASSVAEKLLQVIHKPIKIESHEFTITTSIGICIYPNDATSLEELLRSAEIALEKAKRAGGKNYQFYAQEMDIEAREFVQLESALRKAVQTQELTLYYQPKLNLKKGSITGVEALLRWVHPELGTVPPNKLIALAEETGLIMPIFEWALREACQTNKSWQEEGYEHITVALNVSPKQFHHPNMIKIIQQVLQETNLNPQYLELEIDESTAMYNTEKAMQILEDLKGLGVILSLDHFGTGYTSISHLKKFPISILKIDKNFIKGVPHTPNDVAISSAFIALAHNLGLEVIAEGVETAEQVQFFSQQGCDMIQGYFLSHPLPAHKILLQLRKLRDEVLI